MLMLLFLIGYCGLFYIIMKRKKRMYSSLPNFSGGLPILGVVNLLPKDAEHAWNIVKDVSLESLKKGENLVISLGPFDLIALTDPEDSAIILNSSSTEKHYIYTFAKPWIGNSLLTSSTSLWQGQRKIMYPMFSQQVLNGYIGIFNRQAKRLVDNFTQNVDKGPFDHRRHLVLNGLETVCQTVLGIDLGDQTLSEFKHYIEAVDGLMDGFIKRFHTIWLHSDMIYGWSSLKRSQSKHLKLVHDITNKLIKKRKKELITTKNINYDNSDTQQVTSLIDRLLKVTDETFTDEEIREQLDAVVLTGYDTSAHELIYTLMLLGSHQDVQDKLYTEIKSVFENSNRDVERQDLPKLTYMDAVLKESLRLYPVTPLVARRNTADIKLKNCTLPEGSHCVVSLYAINRHPVWGADANDFNPDRWLDPISLPDSANAFASFGLGKRACIGKTYALMSMKITLTHIVRQFKIQSDISKLVLKMDPVLRPSTGQHIIVEFRK